MEAVIVAVWCLGLMVCTLWMIMEQSAASFWCTVLWYCSGVLIGEFWELRLVASH